MFQKNYERHSLHLRIAILRKKKEWNIYSAECISKSLNVVGSPTQQSIPGSPGMRKNKGYNNFNTYFWQSITSPES